VAKKINILIVYLLKFKIEKFFNENKISFIICHYKENFDYLKFLPSNQSINIYCKSDLKLPKKYENINFFKIENTGREYHAFLHHIVLNYSKLSKINFFMTGSIFESHERFSKFKNVFSKVSENSKKFKGVYTSDTKHFLLNFEYFKKKKLNEVIDVGFRGKVHEKNNKKINLVESKIHPLGNWFNYHFKGKRYFYLSSMNGIFAVNKENILSIPLEKFKELKSEYTTNNASYESGHFLERLYPSIFYL